MIWREYKLRVFKISVTMTSGEVYKLRDFGISVTMTFFTQITLLKYM